MNMPNKWIISTAVFSVMHDTYDSMSAKIMDAYDVLHEKYPFFFQFHSRVKPIILVRLCPIRT